MNSDTIRIHRLRAITRVGVPNAERAEPQEVEICLSLLPARDFKALDDDIANTIDYYKVSQGVLKIAASGERKLIESLAEDVAGYLLNNFEINEVEVEIRKFILPETEYVAVVVRRERSALAE